jgi:hypothetical protein
MIFFWINKSQIKISAFAKNCTFKTQLLADATKIKSPFFFRTFKAIAAIYLPTRTIYNQNHF